MLLMDKSGSEDLVRARILQQTRVRTTKLITDSKTLMEQGTAVQERPKRRRDSLLPECEEEEEKTAGEDEDMERGHELARSLWAEGSKATRFDTAQTKHRQTWDHIIWNHYKAKLIYYWAMRMGGPPAGSLRGGKIKHDRFDDGHLGQKSNTRTRRGKLREAVMARCSNAPSYCKNATGTTC